MNDLRISSVKRDNEVYIKINGATFLAYSGETLLAVLIASGIKKIRKSSVLNEPRGGLCGMGVCYDCLVTVNGTPNIRACMTYVEEGMEVKIDD